MTSISVDGLVAGWTLELVLRERMWSPSQFATATAGAIRQAGFEILPTVGPCSVPEDSSQRLVFAGPSRAEQS